VKIKNPEDEKYFKDITLKNILKEISNEHDTDTDIPVSSSQENQSQTSFFGQMIIFGLLPIVLLFFFFIPFTKVDRSTTKKQQAVHIPQTETDSIGRAKMKETHVKHKKTIITKMTTHTSQQKEAKTQREVARESLKNTLIKQLEPK